MKMINSQKKGQVIWDADWESDYVCKKKQLTFGLQILQIWIVSRILRLAR